MEKTALQNKILQVEKDLTQGALFDLKMLLHEIKGRTLLLTNSLNSENPMQKHFEHILLCLNGSIEARDFLADAFEVNNLFGDNS